MKRTVVLVLLSLVPLACGDTDVDGAREAMTDTLPEVQPVDLDTVGWFVEGRDVVFNERTWIVAGEPVIDPVVTRVGAFEGTPLYADVNTSPPYDELYVPLRNDYWQLLEEGPSPASDTIPVDTLTTDTTPADTTPMDTAAAESADAG